MATIALFLIAAVVGVGIGMLSGMLGIGGGMVMVPAFRLAFGLSAVASTATSLFTIIPTSVSGAIARMRSKTCLPKLGVALGVGGALTSPLGVWLAQLSPSWLVMVAAALVIAYSAFTVLRKALAPAKGLAQQKEAAGQGAGSQANRAGGANLGNGSSDNSAVSVTPAEAGVACASGAPAGTALACVSETSAENGASCASDAQEPPQPVNGFVAPEFSALDLVRAIAIGAAAGVASGFVGLGGGFIMVPLMVSLMNLPMRIASGTSLIAVMILATPATIMQCALGNVDYLVGIAVACGSIPGAVLGARLAARIPERALRLVFAAFLGVAAVLLVVKELGLLGA